jgi:S1-C subfamily serine protease
MVVFPSDDAQIPRLPDKAGGDITMSFNENFGYNNPYNDQRPDPSYQQPPNATPQGQYYPQQYPQMGGALPPNATPQGQYYPQQYPQMGGTPSPYFSPQNPWQAPAQAPQPPEHSGARRGAFTALAIALVLVLGVGLFAGWVFASHNSTANATSPNTQNTTSPVQGTSNSAPNSAEAQQETAISKVEPAVVELDVNTDQGQAIGSGVIIDQNGNIVTNDHVVNGAQSINAVLSNGMTEQATLVGEDTNNDLAVVHIQPFAHMAVATIGNSSQLTVGQEVMAIGNPLGINETATSGIVSALNRSAQESNNVTLNNLIQTDAPINPGNSGGALINLQGQLVGIPTLTAVNTESNTPANGVGFAIPANTIQTVVAHILQ